MFRFLSLATLCLFLSLSGSACSQSQGNRSSETTTVFFTNQDGSKSPSLNLEVVRTQQGIQRGLMYRKELGATEGMLFVFSSNEPRSFWMKNTFVELDIIFISEDLTIDSIQKRAKPLTTKRRPSKGSAQYVVEVVGGSSDHWKLSPGSKLALAQDFATHSLAN